VLNLMRSLRFLLVSVLLLGLGYPLFVTLVAQVFFPTQANGSLVRFHGRVVGSTLIAQRTTAPGLFWPRPSAAGYDAMASTGSNLGPTNPALVQEVRHNLALVLKANPGVRASMVPPSMVESSASGLDPDITVTDALLQVPRVARADHLTPAAVRRLVRSQVTGPILGLWGRRMIDVLDLNLALLQKLGTARHG
jgi:K+-transporting ATPase ATPase C chain